MYVFFNLIFKIVTFLAKHLEWYGNWNVIKWNGARTKSVNTLRFDSYYNINVLMISYIALT